MPQLTNLFMYKILFAVEILSALYLFTWNRKKRSHPFIRYSVSIILVLLCAIFYPIPSADFTYSWWYSSLMFFIIFLCSSATLFFIFNIPIIEVIFFSILAYAAQHLSYQIFSMISLLIHLDSSLNGVYNSNIFTDTAIGITILRLALTVTIFTLVYVFVYVFLICRLLNSNLKFNRYQIFFISAVILATDVIVNSVVVNISKSLSITAQCMYCIYSIANCLMVLFLLYFVLANKKLQTDLDVSDILLKEAEAKYEERKENVDLINIKCHDLKHQIHMMSNQKSIDKDMIKQIENSIDIYDSTVHTGNEALDLILVEKKLACQKNSISMKIFADAKDCNFISNSDLYSLFGNAIDNAIEAVSKIEEKEKRIIDIIIKTSNGFISILIENYYIGKIHFNSIGNPITTKENNGYHGFGTQSIKLIVEKYSGSITIKTDGGLYSMMILIPIKEYTQNA